MTCLQYLDFEFCTIPLDQNATSVDQHQEGMRVWSQSCLASRYLQPSLPPLCACQNCRNMSKLSRYSWPYYRPAAAFPRALRFNPQADRHRAARAGCLPLVLRRVGIAPTLRSLRQVQTKRRPGITLALLRLLTEKVCDAVSRGPQNPSADLLQLNGDARTQ
jgi:hypothetical protein